MKKKTILSGLNDNSTMYLLSILGLILLIPAFLHGPLGQNNPFYIASCGLAAQVFLRGVSDDFRFKRNAEKKKAFLLGVANLVTVVVLLFAMPDAGPDPTTDPSKTIAFLLYLMLLGGFFNFGVRDTFSGIAALCSDIQDGKEFKALMEEAAEKARTEQALVDDLSEFLAEFGPDNTESKEE